jgi:rRNA maturation RNase YbeY
VVLLCIYVKGPVSNISFVSIHPTFRIKGKTELRRWILSIVTAHDFHVKQLDFIFCSDAYLLEINKTHLGHDYYTDIVTFDLSEKESHIISEVYISIDRAFENGLKYKRDDELPRIIIHGVLHLLGYKDKTKKDKLMMRLKEEECLNMFHVKIQLV